VVAEWWANSTRLVVAATSGVTKAFAVPLSLGISGVVRVIILKRDVARIYEPRPETDGRADVGEHPVLEPDLD
jgi:hypothetical protein